MGINIGDVITASDFIALKARVKAECERRKYNGSVESYAGSEYDYTVAPQAGNVPLPEHFNKIIVPMNAMVDTGRTATQNGFLVRQLKDISDSLTTLESIKFTAESSGCKASCTGLCQGTCTTECSGCTGSCSGGCGGRCTGSCKNSCDQTCTYSCYDNCDSGCYGECATGCDSTCLGGCKGACRGSCQGSASGGV